MSFSVTDEFNAINQSSTTNQNTSTVDVDVTFGEMVASEIISANFNEDIVEDNIIAEDIAINTTNSTYGISTDDYMMARNISNNTDVSDIYVEETEEINLIAENQYTSDVLSDEEIAYAVDNLLDVYYRDNEVQDIDAFIQHMENLTDKFELNSENFYDFVDAYKVELKVLGYMNDSLTIFDTELEKGNSNISDLSVEDIAYIKEQYNDGNFETKDSFDAFLQTLVEYDLISENTYKVIDYNSFTVDDLNDAINDKYDTTTNYGDSSYGRLQFHASGVDGYFDEELGEFVFYPDDLTIKYSDSDWNGNTDYWLDFLNNKYEDLYNYLYTNNYSTYESQKGLDCIEELKNILSELNNI